MCGGVYRGLEKFSSRLTNVRKRLSKGPPEGFLKILYTLLIDS